jgi:hypothetical protein
MLRQYKIAGMRSLRPTFNATTTIAFLFVAFALACLMPLQSDTWWHLRAGQEMWSRHFVMLHDEFSFTAAGAYWPNHEWLSEIVFYLAYRAGGLPGLTALAALCVTATLALSWRLMQGGPSRKLWLMAAAMPSLVSVWTVRPHVFTLLFMMVLIHLLLRRLYWPVPALFVLWANLHGGVALGFVVLAAVALGEGWRAGRAALVRVLVVTAICFAASLATPLGVDLWKAIPMSVQKSMAIGISEYRPPLSLGWLDLAFWVIAVALMAAVVVRRPAMASRENAAVVFVAVALLPAAFRYSRNITPFVLMAVPALSRLALPVPAASARAPRIERYGLNVALLAGCIVAGILAVAGAWSVPVERLQWHPMSPSVIDAIRSCPGRLYNRFDDGGYVIWFVPGVPVFVDNRQDPYPLIFLQDHLRREKSGDFEEVFAQFMLRCAFLPPESPTAERLLSHGWRVTARDRRWLVLQSP